MNQTAKLKALLPYAETEKQKARLDAYIEHGSRALACVSLGITMAALKRSMVQINKRARKNGHSKVSKPFIYANEGSIVGIIGDTHIPYCLKGYLEFCKTTFEREGVTRVIHIGDLIDNHALSFHDSEPGLKGARGEYLDAKKQLQPWFDNFPKLTLISGNHDRIPARQLTKLGMSPEVYLRPMKDVYEFPKGWEEISHIVIDKVLYHHGETACGVNGFRNDAKDRMTNTVTGHAHGNLGVSYTACDHRLVFGMAVGCGIDNSLMAFAYGKLFKKKPIVGCGVVKYGKNPQTFALDLGEK